ncbi:MAG: SRPBCC domain-containing protein [candidate division Zixibacteria bacterium]|nr:SRPBCC domain-containing protein [candidate division Zixibacteria bacterium]
MTNLEQYFVQLHGTREGWPGHMTNDESRVMQEHYLYLKHLAAGKKVLMAGPCFDPVFGLIILQVQSEAEAREIMENEPSVVHGVHTYTMHPMRVSILADYQRPERFVDTIAERILTKEVVVQAEIGDVWKAWTTTDGITTFFAPRANVDLRPGGVFEIYFIMSEPYGLRGSEDCRILSYLPETMLSFEWSAPPSFGVLRDVRTQVVLQFEKADAEKTIVRLAHLGWGIGEEWDRLYDYFDTAWSYVLGNLHRRFIDGPIDWTK